MDLFRCEAELQIPRSTQQYPSIIGSKDPSSLGTAEAIVAKSKGHVQRTEVGKCKQSTAFPQPRGGWWQLPRQVSRKRQVRPQSVAFGHIRLYPVSSMASDTDPRRRTQQPAIRLLCHARPKQHSRRVWGIRWSLRCI